MIYREWLREIRGENDRLSRVKSNFNSKVFY